MTPQELDQAMIALEMDRHQFAEFLRMSGKHAERTVRHWLSGDNVRGVPGTVELVVEQRFTILALQDRIRELEAELAEWKAALEKAMEP